jgi:5-methylcytosine-specific restriction endonuclease McrA
MKQRKPIPRRAVKPKSKALWKQISDVQIAANLSESSSTTSELSSVRGVARQILKRSSGKQRNRNSKLIKKITEHQKRRLAKLKEIRDRWWREGKRRCGICGKQINTREEYTLDHIEPGNHKSDDESNLQPAHGICNTLKGSQRNFHL